MKWTWQKVKCNLCYHFWIAVYPAHLDKLECPNCNNMNTFIKDDRT
jgi:phage FluMu protein Com